MYETRCYVLVELRLCDDYCTIRTLILGDFKYRLSYSESHKVKTQSVSHILCFFV